MKFLCDNCKAKYQIADEKLQGRAVQMKCRKCGHVIEVPSLTAGIAAPVQKPAEPQAPAPGPEASAVRPAPAPAPAPTQRPVRPAPAATRPSGGIASHAAAAVAAATPAPARQSAPLRQVAAPARAPAQQSGLAGAFSKTVKEKDVSQAIEVLSAGAAEEWYVGVNGVPLGPVRLAVLRQKAAQGAINEDSLVWREGFDEWLPLRQFPELVVLVQEAREHAVRGLGGPAGQAGRISAAPQPPATRPPARTAPASRAQTPTPAPVHVSPAPGAVSPAAGFDPFAPSTSGAAGAVGAPMQGAAQGGMTPAPGAVGGDFGMQQARASGMDVMADPFAAAGPGEPGVVTGGMPAAGRTSVLPESVMRPSIVDEVSLGVRKQVRVHPAAVAFIGLLGMFGGVMLTIWLLGGKNQAQPPPTVQIVTVTAPPTQPQLPPGAVPTSSGGIAMAENNVVGDNTRPNPTGGPSKEGKTEPSKKDDPKAAATSPLNTGLDMPGVPGPAAGGPTPGGGNSSLPQLEQADIQRVVSSNVGFVKRQCWEPALASRSPNAPTSAKVSVMLTIAPDGSVQSANASGGSGYPDLASCVAGRVRGWKFPPSSGSSTANIPFVFASQ
ncbi:MAG: zinc-ribbon domain-containing protein [Deltaproteobacteria bacterium]|nr:zinc-ribbon domain-containing protein [Deltaproteobacteria bacterium]